MSQENSKVAPRTTTRDEEYSSMAKLTHEVMKRLRRYENIIENCPYCKEVLESKDATL